MTPNDILPHDASQAVLVGRLYDPEVQGPSVVVLKGDRLVDMSALAATMADLLEAGDPVALLRDATGGKSWDLATVLAATPSDLSAPHLLAPCDLQAVKACGVTFARSMIERVIEERAKGDSARANEIREEIGRIIGGALSDIKAGSPEAAKAKEVLIKGGYWSQYLEVGIGPDAEVFTKAPVLASVGHGAEIGILPSSAWNNPEPEVVLAVDSTGRVRGATLGNDVNLRDVEGRSALLLGKAKDNNASSSIGPFIRLFDETFTIDDVRTAELTLTVTGPEGYVLEGRSSMKEISRDPLDLVGQTLSRHHQYPDGFLLFLGTLFAPTEDRDVKGQGFTHRIGDVVEIASPKLGRLVNTVTHSDKAPEWRFGIRDLMRNLAGRGLLSR
ncbi:fumarylacetoacetate hydrolase [Aureimonas sp. SA4125]|uniref:fumarylacetoacetate hydrolase family protein n=1 Tax=Aureimonas sp. SA4125 TaxID=2826993 RepID=UPI001CC7A216|nr:fumarylacetoacetate hydrolase family protein [Aureimonas sp. SA4125]BDA85705.1 fumarylacetoacetate hydrolase [Aureimonas sp. SA4125]